MAGVKLVAVTAENATGVAKKTLLQIVAAANHRVLVKEVAISFKGIVNTNPPILVELYRQTDAGTMSALTPQKWNPGDDETLQTTAQENATVEPAGATVIFREEVHPQGGYTWQLPFGWDISVPGGTRLGVAVTATVSVSAIARTLCEE
jgi:hypothetical protein